MYTISRWEESSWFHLYFIHGKIFYVALTVHGIFFFLFYKTIMMYLLNEANSLWKVELRFIQERKWVTKEAEAGGTNPWILSKDWEAFQSVWTLDSMNSMIADFCYHDTVNTQWLVKDERSWNMTGYKHCQGQEGYSYKKRPLIKKLINLRTFWE